MAASQSRAFPSSPPVSAVLPSGLRAATIAVLSWIGVPRLPGGGVPEPGGPVTAPSQEGLAIPAEGHRLDRTFMDHRLADGDPSGEVPELGSPVIAPREDSLTIGAERCGSHPFLMFRQDPALKFADLGAGR